MELEYSVATLGRGVVRSMQSRATSPVVTIGRDRFSRHDLAPMTFNFIAALRLSEALARLKVKDTKDVFFHIEPEQLAIPGIGPFAYAVLGVCFALKGLGTLDDWVERTRQKNEKITTFATMKNHIHKTTTKSVKRSRNSHRTSHHAAAASIH